MKKFVLLPFFTVCCFCLFAQHNSVSVIDFVKINAGKAREAYYFYENNWKVYRDIALAKGYIKSYRIYNTTADSTADFDLMLVTEYTDSAQLKLSEARFNDIIKQERPTGAKLLNELKPNDFRQNVFNKKAATLYKGGD